MEERAVVRSKVAAWAEWYDKIETKEGQQEIYRIAKMRTKKKKDICHVQQSKTKMEGYW